MDYRVTWSPEALDDVEAIAEYIERGSPIYARAVVQKLLDAARTLNTFPNAGRVVPELGDGYHPRALHLQLSFDVSRAR